jgi:hypothetical protein
VCLFLAVLYGAYVPATPAKPAATVIVSSASGLAVANTVETLFQAVAAKQGAHLAVLDIRPLPAGDRSGESLFFFLAGCSVAGFLTIVATGALAPALRPRYRFPLILAAAVAISGPAGAIVAPLGTGALYVLIVAMIARGLQVILGPAAIIAFLAILVMLAASSMVNRKLRACASAWERGRAVSSPARARAFMVLFGQTEGFA